MSNNKSLRKGFLSDQGNGTVVALVILIIIGLVGILALMSGKIMIPDNNNNTKEEINTASIHVSDDGSSRENPKEDSKSNPVLAKVGNDYIRRQEIIDLVNTMPEQMRQIPLDKLFPMALEQLINNKIISDKAKDAGLDNNAFVQNQLKQAKEQIIRTKFLEDAVKAKITDERLKKEYDEYVANFEKVEEVKVSHILVDDKKLAKDIISKLGKGADFATLAKENSKDGSAKNGGDLGYFTEKEVVPEFAKAAFSTKVGEYSKTPVKTNFGYHVIKVYDKRIRPAAKFAKVKPYLEQKLQRAILDELITSWRDGVEIERFDINGKPIADQEPAAGVGEKAAPVEQDSKNVEVKKSE